MDDPKTVSPSDPHLNGNGCSTKMEHTVDGSSILPGSTIKMSK